MTTNEVSITTADGRTVTAPFEGRFRVRLGDGLYHRLRQYGPETAVGVAEATIFYGRQNAEDHAAVCRAEGWPAVVVEVL